MPDVLTHFALPFALTAPFLGLKRAFLIGLIALLPDLDVLVHVHRSATHSIVLLLTFALPLAVLLAYKAPKLKAECLATVLSLISHPLLDMFQTYTPALYPLVENSIFVNVDAGVLMGESLRPYLDVSVTTMPVDFSPFTSLDAVMVTGQSLPISIALILVPAICRFFAMKSLGKAGVSDPNGALPVQAESYAKPVPDEPAVSPENVTVVIPVLDEAEAIGKVIDELRRKGYSRILVVDGYSSDATAEIARAKGVRVVYQHGLGKAGALKTALEHVDTPYMLVMDGDYTYDPKDIKRMLMHAAKYDEIIGVRTNSKNIGWLHRLGNRAINFAFNLLFGAGLSDVCSGMYLLRTEALRGVELKSKGFSVEVEIAAHMCSSGRITEVPINYRKRTGKKKLKTLRDGLSIFSAVFWLARAYNPVFLLATLASLLAVPGAALTLWQLYIRYIYGAEAWSMGVAWLGLFLLVVGMQGFTVATIALLLKRMEKRIVQSRKDSCSLKEKIGARGVEADKN
jgi:dolichol-phosphate mannosyltransferase